MEEDLTELIIGCSIKLHKTLGPGLFESVYQSTLSYELIKAGLTIQQQVPVPLIYAGKKFETSFRIDILVENRVIVELKAVDRLAPVHYAQILTYLRIARKEVGLLINFNTDYLKNGIHRFVMNTR